MQSRPQTLRAGLFIEKQHTKDERRNLHYYDVFILQMHLADTSGCSSTTRRACFYNSVRCCIIA